MKIGIFGGTFDPFHLGHLGAAIYAREMAGLDQMWILPAAQSPLKANDAVEVHHREKMVEVAIEGIEGLRLDRTDLERSGLSYTIDTLALLRERHPDFEFFLCMSDDVAVTLPKWRSCEELLAGVPLLVTRRLLEKLPKTGEKAIDEAIERGYLETPVVQIEATVIRERCQRGLTCVHLLASPVLAYIQKQGLYGTISGLGDE